jgi:hypothetical protein
LKSNKEQSSPLQLEVPEAAEQVEQKPPEIKKARVIARKKLEDL